MSITRQLAAFIVRTEYEDLPPRPVRLAKYGMADCLGVMFAGAREPGSGMLLRLVEQLGGTPQAQVIASHVRTSPPLAALVNGATGHALDFDDACNFGHPSVVLLPSILALGEVLRSSGRQAILAYVVGFEIGSRFREAFDIKHRNGWHPTSVCGTMAAAAAAAKIMGLGVEQTAMALGIAASQAGGLGANIGSMTKPFHAGNAGRAGIIAAMLAKNGFTSHERAVESSTGFGQAFSGGKPYELGRLTTDLGGKLELETRGLSLKKYPSCYGTHWAIDQVLELMAQEDIQADAVVGVEAVGRPKYLDVLPYTEPKNALQGKFSMHYCVAASILDRAAGLDQFTDQNVQRPAAIALMRKVSLRSFPDWDEHRDAATRPEVLTVRLRDGRVFTRRVLKLPGQDDVPNQWDDVFAAKFRQCVRPSLGHDRTERLMTGMLGLEQVADLVELVDLAGMDRRA